MDLRQIDPERHESSDASLDLAWLNQIKNTGTAVTRKQIAAVVPGSRCTVIRKINQWIGEGRLNREGTARKTLYRVV